MQPKIEIKNALEERELLVLNSSLPVQNKALALGADWGTEEMILVTEKPTEKSEFDYLYRMHLQWCKSELLSQKLGPNPIRETIENAIHCKETLLSDRDKKYINIKATMLAKCDVENNEKEAEFQRKIMQTGHSQANALRSVILLAQERIDFIESNLEIIRTEPRHEVIAYIKREFGIAISIENHDDLIKKITVLFEMGLTCYNKIKAFIKKDENLDIHLDFVYDLFKRLNSSLTKGVFPSIIQKEKQQTDMILRLLKPYLSTSYSSFNRTFIDREGITRNNAEVEFKRILDKEIAFMFECKNAFLTRYKGEYIKYYLEEEQILLDEYLKAMQDVIDLFMRDKKLNHEMNFNEDSSKIDEYNARFIYKIVHYLMYFLNAIEKSMIVQKEKYLKEQQAKVKKEKGTDTNGDAKDSKDNVAATLPATTASAVCLKKGTIGEGVSVEGTETAGDIEEGCTALQKQTVKQQPLPDPDLEAFKQKKLDDLRAWKTECQQAMELKQAALLEAIKELKEDLFDDQEIEDKEKKESDELQEFEAIQLLHVHQKIKDHYTTLQDLFDGKNVNFKDLESLVLSVSKDLIKPEKFVGFNLIKFPGSSHFRAYIPNTHKDWKKAMLTLNRREQGGGREQGGVAQELRQELRQGLKQELRPGYVQQEDPTLLFKLTPRQMSTINGWDHSREMHSGGALSLKAIKRIREGWIKAGITPDRIIKALRKTEMISELTASEGARSRSF